MRKRKSEKVCALSANVVLEAMFIVKRFVSSDGDEVTSGPFMLVGTDVLPLLRLLLNFSVLTESKSFAFYLGLDYVCIVTLCIFCNSLGMRAIPNGARILLHHHP